MMLGFFLLVAGNTTTLLAALIMAVLCPGLTTSQRVSAPSPYQTIWERRVSNQSIREECLDPDRQGLSPTSLPLGYL